MEIKEYLYRREMSSRALANKSGINEQTLSLIKLKIQNPSFKTATKIVSATKGEVGYEELLPEVYYAMAREYKGKE